MQKEKMNDVQKKSRAAEIADSFEWIITALILAFVFRAFVMEAFRIPTGSMAETLMGAHFRLACTQCGYKYNYGFIPEKFGYPSDSMPRGILKNTTSRCPSCGFYQTVGGNMHVSYGDRILVIKCIYEYVEPKRWDVIVFRNPLEPKINFIKRLIALPGETLEIIDGDIYINGQIVSKPKKVQDELWMVVYDNDYLPARPLEPFFNKHIWKQPFITEGTNWQIDKINPTRFNLESVPGQISSLIYDISLGNDFRTTYAYNEVLEYSHLPYCSDLMVKYYAWLAQDSSAGAVLGKYNIKYRASVNQEGEMVITRISEDGQSIDLASKTRKPLVEGKEVLIKFANVDHQLVFEVGDEKLVFEMGSEPQAAGTVLKKVKPQVEIMGSGKVSISHLGIFRDIYYIDSDGIKARAGEGKPFALLEDEFFAMGDNSPASYDSRYWDIPGKGNFTKTYRAGIVPREYLVGKALFVYWPSGFRPWPTFPVPLIPNVGKMRLIYGGKN